MIEVIHFTKHYGDFIAVDDLSFTIGKGETFGFIGPNGAGKSTTIRFLATLLRPTSGEGRVGGFSVTAEPMSVRRVIGFMPDDFGVYDGMKVWEFLDFFAVAYEIPRSYRKKIIGEVLELLDLTHKRDGGDTSTRNCALLCQFHHDVCIHRWGWRLVLHPDATTTAYGPKGQVLHSHGPPRELGQPRTH